MHLLFFKSYKKRSRVCRENCTLQTRYPPLSMVRLSLFYAYNSTNRKGSSLPPGDVLSSSVDLCPGKLHLYIIRTIIFYINLHRNPAFSLIYKTVTFYDFSLSPSGVGDNWFVCHLLVCLGIFTIHFFYYDTFITVHRIKI